LDVDVTDDDVVELRAEVTDWELRFRRRLLVGAVASLSSEDGAGTTNGSEFF
jgi:hypothetical protein